MEDHLQGNLEPPPKMGGPSDHEKKTSCVGGERGLTKGAGLDGVFLPKELLKEREKYPPSGRVFRIRGKRALFLKLMVTFETGKEREIEFLVDTGSEVNLIRPDLVPRDCEVKAERGVRLLVANNEVMEGGYKMCRTRLQFFGMEIGREFPKIAKRNFDADFYLGGIKIEGILSYDWLEQNRLGVMPHRYCLLWDTFWPEWLYDVVPQEEEEEDFGVDVTKLSRNKAKKRGPKCRSYFNSGIGTNFELPKMGTTGTTPTGRVQADFFTRIKGETNVGQHKRIEYV